ncbi:MAG: hypothetical protein NT098_02175 [Candidatus Parcubacteria bacterium]|nr:hypothetical protein [Candidatus Parcubacteria bacterium]
MEINKTIFELVENISSGISDIKDVTIVIFKPDFPDSEKNSFFRFCKNNSLNILSSKEAVLNKEQIYGIYYDIFKQRNDDKNYGISWKIKVLEYLTFGTSEYFLIEGKDAQARLKEFKISIREKYKKITAPHSHIDERSFEETVIKNLIHVTDDGEFVNSCWLLFI